MPIFAVNMKHTPESCPMFNNDVKKKLKEVVGNREEVKKKLGIKGISAYTLTQPYQPYRSSCWLSLSLFCCRSSRTVTKRAATAKTGRKTVMYTGY